MLLIFPKKFRIMNLKKIFQKLSEKILIPNDDKGTKKISAHIVSATFVSPVKPSVNEKQRLF